MPGITRSQDTLVCDNGGFEDGFLYYSGNIATYYKGGDDCSALDASGNPSTWSSISIPANGRFAIVISGSDPLVGIATTKFGSKAARINNYLGHVIDRCYGHRDANKLIKRFKVSAENREFNVWYAAILENPQGHTDSQPFFSISCDLAPSSNLCFDASELDCPEDYEYTCDFSPIQVVDWTCHRISIPESEIGNIATVEIIASDCGCSAHFGYAYVDGFCEECEGSGDGSGTLYDYAYGSNGLGIKYHSCYGDYITICGNYTLPVYCFELWDIDTLLIPGFTTNNLIIDKVNKTFCFDLPKSNFTGSNCRDLFVEFKFSTQAGKTTYVNSNKINICPQDYLRYVSSLVTGACNNNSTTSILSDDYYYVSFNINVNVGDSWTINRILEDPYPGEQGVISLRSGTSSGSISLGPFLIQEGKWELEIVFNKCIFSEIITPPTYCSGCSSFWGAKITNINCDDENTTDPTDDTWSFDIFVPGTSGQGFDIIGLGTNYAFNAPHKIDMGVITAFCNELELKDKTVNPECISKIVVCPPHPCSDNSCTLEAYFKELDCPESNGEFNVNLDVIWSGSGYLCYRSFSKTDPTNTNNSNNRTGQVPSNKIIGTFDEDIYLFIYQCPTSACTCLNTRCFKGLYIPMPDCEDDDFQGSSTRTKINSNIEVNVLPNPVLTNKITIQSNLEVTEFEIFSLNNLKLYSGIFKNSVYSFELNLIPGVYLLKFKDISGEYRVKKFVKF